MSLSPLERELLDACEWARDALTTKSLGLQRRALDRLHEAMAAAETGQLVRCEHDQPPSTCVTCCYSTIARAEALAKPDRTEAEIKLECERAIGRKPLDGAETP